MGEKRDIFSIKRSTLKGTHQTQAPQPWWRPTKPCRPLGSYWNWFCHSHPVTPNILARAGLWNWMTEIRQEEIGSLECQPQPGIADTQLGGGDRGRDLSRASCSGLPHRRQEGKNKHPEKNLRHTGSKRPMPPSRRFVWFIAIFLELFLKTRQFAIREVTKKWNKMVLELLVHL